MSLVFDHVIRLAKPAHLKEGQDYLVKSGTDFNSPWDVHDLHVAAGEPAIEGSTKVHLSFDQNKLEAARNIIIDILQKHKLHSFKIIYQKDSSRNLTGKEVTIYLEIANEYKSGANEKDPGFWINLFNELEDALKKAGIGPNTQFKSQGDKLFPGSLGYIFYRNPENIIKHYIAADDLSKAGFTSAEAFDLCPPGHDPIQNFFQGRMLHGGQEVKQVATPSLTQERKLNIELKFPANLTRIQQSILQNFKNDMSKLASEEVFFGDPPYQNKDKIQPFEKIALILKLAFGYSGIDMPAVPSELKQVSDSLNQFFMGCLNEAAEYVAKANVCLSAAGVKLPGIDTMGNIIPAVYKHFFNPILAEWIKDPNKPFSNIVDKDAKDALIQAIFKCAFRDRRMPQIEFESPQYVSSLTENQLNELFKQLSPTVSLKTEAATVVQSAQAPQPPKSAVAAESAVSKPDYHFSSGGRRDPWDGYTLLDEKGQKRTIESSVKVHFSFDQDKIDIAKPKLLEILKKHKLHSFKILHAKYEQSRNVMGKEVTIYLQTANDYKDGAQERDPEFWIKVFNELEDALIKADVTPNKQFKAQGDKLFPGSRGYIYYRNPENILNRYIDANELNRAGFTNTEAYNLCPTDPYMQFFKNMSLHAGQEVRQVATAPTQMNTQEQKLNVELKFPGDSAQQKASVLERLKRFMDPFFSKEVFFGHPPVQKDNLPYFDLMTSDTKPENHMVYFRKEGKHILYSLIAPNGELVRDVKLDKPLAPEPFDISALYGMKLQILEGVKEDHIQNKNQKLKAEKLANIFKIAFGGFGEALPETQTVSNSLKQYFEGCLEEAAEYIAKARACLSASNMKMPELDYLGNIIPAIYRHFFSPILAEWIKDPNKPFSDIVDKDAKDALMQAIFKCAFRDRRMPQIEFESPQYVSSLTENQLNELFKQLSPTVSLKTEAAPVQSIQATVTHLPPKAEQAPATTQVVSNIEQKQTPRLPIKGIIVAKRIPQAPITSPTTILLNGIVDELYIERDRCLSAIQSVMSYRTRATVFSIEDAKENKGSTIQVILTQYVNEVIKKLSDALNTKGGDGNAVQDSINSLLNIDNLATRIQKNKSDIRALPHIAINELETKIKSSIEEVTNVLLKQERGPSPNPTLGGR